MILMIFCKNCINCNVLRVRLIIDLALVNICCYILVVQFIFYKKPGQTAPGINPKDSLQAEFHYTWREGTWQKVLKVKLHGMNIQPIHLKGFMQSIYEWQGTVRVTSTISLLKMRYGGSGPAGAGQQG